MNRLLVALLSALDAVIQAAAGLAVAAAPLTVLWAVTFGTAADWSALWPAAAAVWHLGSLVPLEVTLPLELLTATGIPADAAAFTLSLAPLAFATFTVFFGLRSGRRAVRSGGGATAVASALVVSGAISAGVALTSRNDLVEASLWPAIVIPASLYTVAVAAGVLVTAWREGDDGGPVDRLHDALDDTSDLASDVVDLIARGTTVVLTGLVGAAGVLVALALVLRGGQVMALFQASNVDAMGAVVLGLGQLAYLPTILVWALSWIAGPGFAVGEGTVVSPAGSDVGVVPGIPVLGALPEFSSPWLLLVALVPIAAGAYAGWIARSRLVRLVDPALPEPVLPRLVVAIGIAVGAGAATAGLAAAASGAIGPGALAHTGPEPGAVALAVGVEVLVGAAVLLLSPRGSHADDLDERAVETHADDPAGETQPLARP